MSKYQTILAVCETHSISKAASKLNYTQSAVSQTIKNFEKELGVPLFKRSKQGMELLAENAFYNERIEAYPTPPHIIRALKHPFRGGLCSGK